MRIVLFVIQKYLQRKQKLYYCENNPLYGTPKVESGAEDQFTDLLTEMLLYTRFCNCLLDCDYVLHIVNFAILY
jgi:hypothetical protein